MTERDERAGEVGQSAESDYPPTCHGCGGQMQPMAHGAALPEGGREVVMVCETCDGPTLETMWGEGADQAVIDTWVARNRPGNPTPPVTDPGVGVDGGGS